MLIGNLFKNYTLMKVKMITGIVEDLLPCICMTVASKRIQDDSSEVTSTYSIFIMC